MGERPSRKNVRNARPRLFQSAPNFGSLTELKMWLEKRCGSAIVHPEFKQQTINDVWQEEQSSLRPIPQAFDGYVAHNENSEVSCASWLGRLRLCAKPSGRTTDSSVVALWVYGGCAERCISWRAWHGKTHLAAAIGVHAIQQHRCRVRFLSTI